MCKFALIEIKAVNGKQNFYKLNMDECCEFDEFEKKYMTANFQAEVKTIYAYMNRIANMMTLTEEKFKDITPKRERIKEYEIKTKNLRVYMIHMRETGKIIIMGGCKKDQDGDLKKFRNIKKSYLLSLE